jgi:hypothetical protein
MKVTQFAKLFAVAALATVGFAANASAAIIFDDFNVNEGHFAQAPNFSGSSANVAASSTADRVTTDSYEGAGNQKIVLNATTTGAATRVRFLSGGGTPANNTSFTTGAGVDGWIGLAIKTTSPGWNVQLWLEGAENNGSAQKNLIADGAWHIYEWNLDDETGGADGWQATGVPGIIGGDIDFQAGAYTLDSILFRHAGAPASAELFIDFYAKSDSGSIAGLLVPEPATLALAGLGMIGLVASGRRKNA